ncbi:MAG: anti-sigma factor antagonist [Chitinivibrionales bacterium]|nr:anti-sigma factor antagonist [Chitinivibrionales bacterium]MBD3397102.1 anti-sigma factor antagonist [Chitinivibrionales bacterium]
MPAGSCSPAPFIKYTNSASVHAGETQHSPHPSQATPGSSRYRSSILRSMSWAMPRKYIRLTARTQACVTLVTGAEMWYNLDSHRQRQDPMAIKITTRTAGENEILVLEGRIVNVDSDKFKGRLESFSEGGRKKVIIELTKVDFIDSFGLGAIVGHHTMLQEQGRDMVILNMNPDPQGYIRRLFEMTSLDTIFKIVDKEEDL